MTEQNQKQLGNTLRSTANQLREAMDAESFSNDRPVWFQASLDF